jgi:hypothetical protein
LILFVSAVGSAIALSGKVIRSQNDVDITQAWVRVAIAAIGALSVYLGYRLFCDRRPVLLTNLISGALLAVFGLGILVADARSLRASGSDSHPASRQRKATEEGSFRAPGFDQRVDSGERTI